MTGILHIVRNAVSYDSRVLKETLSIQSYFPDRRVAIAGFHEKGYTELESFKGIDIRRFRLTSRPLPKNLLSQAIKYFEWRYRLIKAYRHLPIQVIHCHDLEPLPIAVKIKKLTGARLIYDAHELETERNGVKGIRKKLSQWQEQGLMPFVDRLITVSPSIRDWYAQRYPSTPMSLVRNIPQNINSSVPTRPLRTHLGIPDQAVLFLYLGGLGKGRGVETILEGFSSQEVKHHVLFMGSGPLLVQVKSYAQKCHRIHYQPPVVPDEVIAYARGADVGLCMYEDTCLNHRYCLPNKLFESVLAGLPVLASNLPDQAKIVRDHQAGWVIPPNAKALREFLCQLDASTARQMRMGLTNRVKDLRWDNEAKILLGVYEGLLS